MCKGVLGCACARGATGCEGLQGGKRVCKGVQGNARVCSPTKSPGEIRACPVIRAFWENCPDNARIFVVLPGFFDLLHV